MKLLYIIPLVALSACASGPTKIVTTKDTQQINPMWLSCQDEPKIGGIDDQAVADYIIDLRLAYLDCSNKLKTVRSYLD